MKSIYTTLVILGISLISHSQTIIYVDADATGNNDGTSWADAFTDLFHALNNSATGAEVWIAEGYYTTANPWQSFTVQNDLYIYGGFNGTETARDQRDFRNNLTILSGDTGWNDAGTAPGSTSNWSDNSEHVIEILTSNYVVIDGLIIEHGYGTSEAGGGVYVNSTDLASLTIQNCTIRKNGAMNRAGVLYYSNAPNSTFNFFNNVVESNYNLGNNAYTIEYRLSGNAGISGVANIANNLFKGNVCSNVTAGAICGRFTNLAPGPMDVHLVNNTIIDNPHGSYDLAPFAYEFGSGSAVTNLFINNNILYNNANVTSIMTLTVGNASQVNYSNSYENVQDFPDFEGLSNTHVVASSPFLNYANGNYQPIAQFQTSGNAQAYSSLYPTYDLDGNDRMTSTGLIGIGANQVDENTSGVTEMNETVLHAFPNPATEQFTISWNEFTSGELTLMNLLGQPVLKTNFNGSSVTCNTSQLEAGTYIALVELDGSIHKTHITIR